VNEVPSVELNLKLAKLWHRDSRCPIVGPLSCVLRCREQRIASGSLSPNVQRTKWSGTAKLKRPSRYRLLSLNPRRARPPATTRAIQLAHIGIDQSPMMTDQSITIRARSATRENVLASIGHHSKFLTQDSTRSILPVANQLSLSQRRVEGAGEMSAAQWTRII
jgi:hypothetical protein